MKTIVYRVTYGGVLRGGSTEKEFITVSARSINSGFSKALKRALEPLGNGKRLEIARIEFWEVK